jgi:hypothetical protein
MRSLFALSALVLVLGCGGKTEDVPTTTDSGACRKGDKQKQDCNTCTCGDDGQWWCTTMACIDSGPTECVPGSTKKLDCNSCSCMSDGRWACTGIACVDSGVVDAGNDPRCPSSWAAAKEGDHNDLCDAMLSCSYADGSCTCPAYCGGPAPGPDWKPTWTCTPKPPPRTDGCPDAEPADATSCSLASGKSCMYGSCCMNQYECISGKWRKSGPICPP